MPVEHSTFACADTVRAMPSPSTAEPTPQRLSAIREQLKLLADYL
jgi:hypothetical protein